MSADDDLERRLEALGRRVAPTRPIADEVMRRMHEMPAGPSRGPAALLTSVARTRFLVPLAAGLAGGFLLGLFCSSAAFPARGEDHQPGTPLAIRVARVQSEVFVRHQQSSVWRALNASSGIYAGDRFHVSPTGFLALSLADGSSLTIGSASVFALDTADGGLSVDLQHGTLRTSLSSQPQPFLVETPQGRLESLGTEFTVTVREGNGDKEDGR